MGRRVGLVSKPESHPEFQDQDLVFLVCAISQQEQRKVTAEGKSIDQSQFALVMYF